MHGISKAYGGVQALSEANFECHAGEVHGLLGENGAGKSTLVKILGGAVRADKGDILLFDKTVRLGSPQYAMRAGVGMVYQELSLLPDLTVAENLVCGNFPKRTWGIIGRKELNRQAQSLLARLNLNDIDVDAKIGQLSLTHRQLIEIAKVIGRNPQVIILDEATSALTQDKGDWLLNTARNLASAGKVVVFISHRMSEVMKVADRVTVFRGGKDVGTREVASASTDELVELMLGRKISRLFPAKISVKQSGNTAFALRNFHVETLPEGVNLELSPGEIVGVGGLVGQGQDALFLGIYGLLRARGEMWLNGRKIYVRNPRDAIREGIAFVPEDRGSQGLVLPLSIRHNASLAILSVITNRVGLIQSQKESGLIADLMRRLRVSARDMDVAVATLSGGNQQKIVFAKVLAIKPQVLLLYDCTRGVDVGTKADIFQYIQELAREHVSVLYYSTDVEELVNLCDRVMVMADGHIRVELEGAQLTANNIIRASVGESILDLTKMGESS